MSVDPRRHMIQSRNNVLQDIPDMITVDLSHHPSGTPLGMLLAPAVTHSSPSEPDASTVVIIACWERLPSSNVGNKLGPIQRTGNVRLGDRLIQINGVYVTDMTFRTVMDLLQSLIHGKSQGVRLKSMSFAPLESSSHHRQQQQGQNNDGSNGNGAYSFLSSVFMGKTESTGNSVGNFMQLDNQKLYAFSSSVRRARIRRLQKDEDGICSASDDVKEAELSQSLQAGLSENVAKEEQKENLSVSSFQKEESFVEYEIKCNLVLRHGAGGNLFRIGEGYEERTWSVWKRFSEFRNLHQKLLETYGWQMSTLNGRWGVSFPPRQIFLSILIGTMDPCFVERRCIDLERYWQTLHSCDEMFDFANPSSHRYSRDMAMFLEIEYHFHRNRPLNNSQTIGQSGGSYSGSRGFERIPYRQRSVNGNDSISLLSAPFSTHQASVAFSRQSGHSEILIKHGRVKEIMVANNVAPVATGRAVRRKKRISGAAKPAFQRHLMD